MSLTRDEGAALQLNAEDDERAPAKELESILPFEDSPARLRRPSAALCSPAIENSNTNYAEDDDKRASAEARLFAV